MYTVDNFIEGLQKIWSNMDITQCDGNLVISRREREYSIQKESIAVIGRIPINQIQEQCDILPEDVSLHSSILYHKQFVEVPVKPQDRLRMPPYRFLEREEYALDEHGYSFNISKMSEKYLVAIVCSSTMDSEFYLDLPIRMLPRDSEMTSLEDLAVFFRILTSKISSPQDSSQAEFKKLMQAYLFNIAYNSNVVFSTVNLFDGRQPMRRHVRRNKGQLFPYNSYKGDLVEYYNQALSTDIPFTQYLAFYHVAEFFFQTISEQDAFEEIEKLITRPSFSPYRKEDIRSFYNKIKKKMRDQKEDGVWDEKTGLLLCLKKYVTDIEMLKQSIETIDVSAIDYYKNNEVPFADGTGTIDFNNNSEDIYKLIRNRVYAVRNAIVHSKEGERLRYQPFKHDHALSKEIPLIRAIAEEIIINSSVKMKLK